MNEPALGVVDQEADEMTVGLYLNTLTHKQASISASLTSPYSLSPSSLQDRFDPYHSIP